MIFLAFQESIQLVPDGTLFVHIAIILLMVFVLNRVLFKPINRVLDERDRRTRGRTGEAKDILHRVDEGMARYEQALREARGESYRLLEQQRAEAMAVRQSKINSVREDVSVLLEEQKRAIHTQAEDARAVLGAEASRVAANVSANVLGRAVGGSPQSSAGV